VAEAAFRQVFTPRGSGPTGPTGPCSGAVEAADHLITAALPGPRVRSSFSGPDRSCAAADPCLCQPLHRANLFGLARCNFDLASRNVWHSRQHAACLSHAPRTSLQTVSGHSQRPKWVDRRHLLHRFRLGAATLGTRWELATQRGASHRLCRRAPAPALTAAVPPRARRLDQSSMSGTRRRAHRTRPVRPYGPPTRSS
jgi:hypothetical protein